MVVTSGQMVAAIYARACSRYRPRMMLNVIQDRGSPKTRNTSNRTSVELWMRNTSISTPPFPTQQT